MALKMTYADYAIQQLKNYTNKNHWRARNFKKDIEKEISDLRLLAYKQRGTIVGIRCSELADKLDKSLMLAMKDLELN